MNRIVLVPKGLTFKKRTQTRVAGRYVPRYNKATVAGGKKTAFRHTRYRKLEYRKRIFQFRITRDDGTIIDETTLRYYGQGINIYQKKDEYPNPTEVWQLRMVGSAHGRDEEDIDDLQYWTKNGDVWNYKNDSDLDYIIEFSYNTITKIWTVPFYEWQTVKKNEKCFVRFICDDSTSWTWYAVPENPVRPEYIYKLADRFQDDDRIKPKFYEVAMPYWKIAASQIGDSFSPPPDYPDTWWPDTGCIGGGFSSTYVKKTIIVYSSVQYNVNFTAQNSPNAAYYGNYNPFNCYMILCTTCEANAWEHWYCIEIDDQVTATSSNGDSSSNIKDNPIDSEKNIIPDEYTVDEQTHEMDFTYTGLSSYEMVKVCAVEEAGDSEITFYLPFKFFKFSGSPYASIDYYS